MAEQVGDVGLGLGPVVGARGRHWKLVGHRADFLLRLNAQRSRQAVRREGWHSNRRRAPPPVGNAFEQRRNPSLHVVEAFVAERHQGHLVCGVVRLEECLECIQGAIAQRIQAADVESGEGMVRVQRHLAGGEGAPAIVLELELELRMHRVPLPLHVGRVEQRSDEELRKAVHALLEVGGVDVEKVVGVVAGGVGVGTAAMGGDEGLVAIHLRVLFGADEQHVLQKVGEARTLLGFVERAPEDRQRGRCLVGVWVRRQQRFEAVGQLDVAVVPLIIGALDNSRQCGRVGHRRGGAAPQAGPSQDCDARQAWRHCQIWIQHREQLLALRWWVVAQFELHQAESTG